MCVILRGCRQDCSLVRSVLAIDLTLTISPLAAYAHNKPIPRYAASGMEDSGKPHFIAGRSGVAGVCAEPGSRLTAAMIEWKTVNLSIVVAIKQELLMTQLLSRGSDVDFEAPFSSFRLQMLPAVPMTQEQFFELCQQNRKIRLERTAQGELIIMPPASGGSGARNATVLANSTFGTLDSLPEQFTIAIQDSFCPTVPIALRTLRGCRRSRWPLFPTSRWRDSCRSAPIS